ncbi:MAG: hypothetical protein HYV42_00400 [Candidatus Magasanikbacteria bacterium]|nr:hypothetical protein [Candidatus Magasanikbacteria bacterium]
MKAYPVKSTPLRGTDFREIRRQAFGLYDEIRKKSKRRPYLRSAFFAKDKIFLDIYWQHLYDQRNWHDRMRRLRFYPCAIELIRKSRFPPTAKENPNKRSEILHRFLGATQNQGVFYVQIKEDKSTNQKFLISIFPHK